MAECLWCWYPMPWPGGSFCSKICHENWSAAMAQEAQVEPEHNDGEADA